MKMDTCVFCNKSLGDGEPTVVLRQRGCDGIEKSSIDRESELRTVVGQTVHVKCRWDYTNPLIIESYRKRTANESEEVDDEQITIHDLINHMRSVITEENCEPYSFPFMKSQLLKHFGERIIIAEINGKPNVVTFHSTASKILHDFHSQKHKDPEQEKAHIIKTAALLIKNDITTIKQS